MVNVGRSHRITLRSLRMVAGVTCIFLLSGCINATQRYGVDKGSGTYFAVPSEWHEVDGKALSKVVADSENEEAIGIQPLVRWEDAFSPLKSIKATDVLSKRAPSAPIAYARVRYLDGAEINASSYNTLRDVVLPITSWADGTEAAPSDFAIIDDGEVAQKGADGIHTRISYSGADQVSQTFDQTALLSKDHRTLHVFIVRCSTKCFNAQSKVLEKIVSSFTVRGSA